MRAVLDPNVIISALLSPGGAPGRVLQAWIDGAFELIVSADLLSELERALAYPKLRKRIGAEEATELIQLLRQEAQLLDDPHTAPIVASPDPGDDYLLALAGSARSAIVSGDGHLLVLVGQLPVYSPTEFLALLDRAS